MPAVVAGLVAVGGAAISAGGIGAAFAAGGLTASIARLGLGLVIQAGVGALTKPSFDLPTASFTRVEPAPAREYVYGAVRKGGPIVFRHQVKGDKNRLHFVIAIADHRVKSIGAMYFDGKAVTDAAGVPISKYSGDLFVEKRLGDVDQTALDQLQQDLPELWTENHRGRGVALVHVRLRYPSSSYPNGVPSITFDVEGCDEIYDPRSDTTGYSDNAALCLAHYMSDPRNRMRAAIGAEDGVRTSALIEAANICDEAIAKAEGGTEPRYVCSGTGRRGADKANIEALLTAMAGKVIWTGADWIIRPGAYVIPTVTLTNDDCREEGLRLSTRVPIADNFNGVRGTYAGAETEFQPDDFPAVQSAVYVAEDGGEERWADITLPFTPTGSAAQRIAKIVLEVRRRQQTVDFRGKLQAWRAAYEATVMLDRDRWGYIDKPFSVSRAALTVQDDRLVADLVLAETSPLVYDWTATEEQIRDAAPPTALPSPFDVEPPSAPVLTERLDNTKDNSGVKAIIDVSWSPGSEDDHRYRVQARRITDLDGNDTGDGWKVIGETDQTDIEIFDVKPGGWEVRVQAVNIIGIESIWSTRTEQILGLAAPPGPIENLQIQTASGAALLSWDPVSALDVIHGGYILIRHSENASPTWGRSTRFPRKPGSTTSAAVPLKPGTYLLRAIDSEGVRGPISTISTDGAEVTPYTSAAFLNEHPTFTGTKTNTEVDGSDLIISGMGSLLPPGDDLTAAGWNVVNATIVSDYVNTPSGDPGDLLREDSTINQHLLGVPARAFQAGRCYRFRATARFDGRNIRLSLPNALFGGSGAFVAFDLQNGAFNLGSQMDMARMIDLGFGWYSCEAEATCQTSGTASPQLLLENLSGQLTYQGDGGSGAVLEDVTLLDVSPDGFEGSYAFASTMDLGSVKTVRLRSRLIIAAENLVTTIDERLEPIDSWEDFDGTDGVEVDCYVEVRTTLDDPSGSPVWDDWRRLDRLEVTMRGAQFRATLTTPTPDVNTRVSQLRVEADEVL